MIKRLPRPALAVHAVDQIVAQHLSRTVRNILDGDLVKLLPRPGPFGAVAMRAVDRLEAACGQTDRATEDRGADPKTIPAIFYLPSVVCRLSFASCHHINDFVRHDNNLARLVAADRALDIGVG